MIGMKNYSNLFTYSTVDPHIMGSTPICSTHSLGHIMCKKKNKMKKNMELGLVSSQAHDLPTDGWRIK